MKSVSLWTPSRFDRPEFGEFARFLVHVTCACGETLTIEASGADTAEGRAERERLAIERALEAGWMASAEVQRCPACRAVRLAEGTQPTFAAKIAGATTEGAMIGGTLCIVVPAEEMPYGAQVVGVTWAACLGSEECGCAECVEARR